MPLANAASFPLLTSASLSEAGESMSPLKSRVGGCHCHHNFKSREKKLLNIYKLAPFQTMLYFLYDFDLLLS